MLTDLLCDDVEWAEADKWEHDEDAREKAAFRQQTARYGAVISIIGHLLGLPIGEIAITENGLWDYVLVCGLIDDIMAALAAEETTGTVPIDLLLKYAMILQAADADGGQYEYAMQLRQIATISVAASFPRTLAPKTKDCRKALTAVEANWLDCLFYDASDLVNEMDASIQVIARALMESGSMEADDLNRLLALVCGEKRIV